MWEFLATPAAQAVISGTVLVALLVLGYYIVRRFRDRIDEDEHPLDEVLTNFREMHHQGEISEREFRDIKTMMGAELQSQTKGDGEAG